MQSYNIGLDIGNTSVGWAVINCDNFKVIRKKNKYLWGVRIFEAANSAADRRIFRSGRRRFDRRRKRLKLLQKEFASEIAKVDPNFFIKLKESFYKEQDSKNKTIKLSNEEKIAIKKYNEDYPTIYHLRNRLIKDKSKCDIRLVYLALHHIIKYRGNFLYENSNFKVDNINIKETLEEIFYSMKNLSNIEINEENLSNTDFSKIEEILFIASKNDRKIQLEAAISPIFPKKITKELVKLLVGDKFSLSNLFNLELEEDLKLSFKGSEFEDNYAKISNIIQEELPILEDLKDIYNGIFLKTLFKGNENTSLSSLMVEKYNNHCEDLKMLKTIYKLDSNLYKAMFKNKKEPCLYEKYIKNSLTYDEFTKKILKDFENLNSYITVDLLKTEETIKTKIEQEIFMPRITSTENGKYPYQLNQEELVTIIENQGQYYPFLLDKTLDGTYKIVKLLAFRIPYYVGPLNNTTKTKNISNPNAWLIKKDNQVNITPYNFEQIIDKEKTAEKFISRMLGTCTYLINEPSMPANSLLYSEFKVLNELKQIRAGEKGHEEKLTKEMQTKIFNDLFLTTSSITDKKFKEYLKSSNEFSMVEDLSVMGYSAENKFANNMASYLDFFGPNGYFNNTNYNKEQAEEIIRLITIFEDKEILKSKLEKEYPELTDIVIKNMCRKKYTGWSNLSQKLLTEIYYHDKKDEKNKSIITLMRETNENFMQIINNKDYNFDEKIKEYNNQNQTSKLNYELISNLVTSPSTKKGIYQALKIIEEIIDFMGYEPQKVTLEMARGDEVKARVPDRKKQLESIYEKYKKEIDRYNKLKKELSSKDKINSEKLYLYFIQEGKSLYSGMPLDINELDQYEVDHIIPRTLIKDDSLENKALVLKEENQNKGANFVLPAAYRSDSMKLWWQHLKKLNLMSLKKYNNLCRYKFDEKSLEGFINRQLVETRQISKHVANIIENLHPKVKVNYIPASLSHNYREKFELFKFREINDYHHAHDAYLAAVLGEYKTTYLKPNIDYEILKDLTKKLYQEHKYDTLKDGYVINSLDPTLNEYFVNNETGEVFDVAKFNETIENTLYRNDILVSKKVEIRTGEFYNQTKAKGNEKVKNAFPLKKNLSEDYGKYTSINPAYAAVVKYQYKEDIKQKMVGIPIIIEELSKKDSNIKVNYLKQILKLNSNDYLEIVKDKIPFYTLLNWDGQICYLVGASDTVEVCNAKEFHFSKTKMQEWKHTLNYLFNHKKETNFDEETYNKQLNEIIEYIVNKITKEYKLYENLIPNLKQIINDIQFSNEEETVKERKEKLIIEILKLLKCDSQTANIKFLNKEYSDSFGRKSLKVISHSKIIHQSVTGLREYYNEF